MQLKYLLFLAFAALVAARTVTVDEVINDLKGLENQAQQLGDNIQNLVAGNIPQELALQQEFTTTKQMIDSTDLDVQNTSSISSDDASTVVSILTQLVATVTDFLQVLVSKKEGFVAFEKAFILKDLQDVGGSIKTLEGDLRAKCPADLQATADDLIARTNDAFNAAINAYSS